MTVRKPEDDDIIDAEIVEEEPVPATLAPEPKPESEPQPPPEPLVLTPIEPAPVKPATPEPTTPAPGPFVGRRAARPKKEEEGGLGIVVLLLIGVLIAAIIWRKELTAFYNSTVGPMFGGEAPSTAPAPVKVTPKVALPPTPAPGETMPPPEPEVPKFEPREAPGPAPKEPEETPAVVPPAPAPEPAPALAYSIIKRENVGYEGLQQFEFKVVVPPTYKRDDLLRMAQAIVAAERKQGVRHAVRCLCFTDPEKTKPEDLFATVDWGPQGDFMKAADAVNKTPDKNEFKVFLKGAP